MSRRRTLDAVYVGYLVLSVLVLLALLLGAVLTIASRQAPTPEDFEPVQLPTLGVDS